MELTLDEALQKAIEAHKAGQIQEADRLYTAILQAQPKHPDANHNMGVLAVSVGKIQEALPYFIIALEAKPSTAQYWLSYIDALIQLDQMVGAKNVLEQAKGKGVKGEAFDELEQRLNALNKVSIGPPKDQLNTLINLYQQGQLQQALNNVKQLLSHFPDSLDLYNIQGAAYAALGHFDGAIDSYKKALKVKPDYAEAYFNMGNALKNQGDREAAIESYTKTLKIKPEFADAYINMGISLKAMGDLEAAIESFKQVLKIKPDCAESHYNLGNVLQDKGDLESAIDSFKKALKIKPDYAEVYNNMGVAFNNKGDLEASIDSFKKALKIKPDYTEAYDNMGNAFNDKGDQEAAINSFKNALKIKPDCAQAYNNMGNALKNKGDLEAAIKSYTKALKIKPNFAEAYNNMGAALKDIGDLKSAINSYKQAIQIKPDFAEAYNNMGAALQDRGDSEAALSSYSKAISIKPDYSEAHRYLSSIKRSDKRTQHHALQMQNLYQDKSITEDQRCNLSFALSKVFEDLKDISRSFNYLKKGNELRKKMLSYDIKQDITLFSRLKKSYLGISKAALQLTVETSELKPIFIIGMPRSGTTLVEQIVSSHSEVKGAGELIYVAQFGQPIATGRIKPNTEIIESFRKSYIEALRQRVDTRYTVTDKMPNNFAYVGLIFSAFPDAKIIHVNRDPTATCWSNYKHYFSTKALGYSYNLDDMVAYFGLYKDLMQFWQEHYGDRIYNLNYDNLTFNQEDETRNVMQYLELDWEDDCLKPQNNKRSVLTASNQQVRKKVYKGSSQQWRKFEPYLNGVFNKLNEFN